MKGRAAVLRAVGAPLSIEEVEFRAPGEGEVLVQLKAAGLCHTDLHFMDGSMGCEMPIVLGHEGAGIVVECGPGVSLFKPGDHAVPFVVPECGHCPACHSTRTNVCRTFFAARAPEDGPVIIDGQPRPAVFEIGSFAEYAVVHESRLANVRRDMPFDQLAYIGCGVATGVGAVFFNARVEAGASVAVFGLGGIGLNVVQGARLAGARTIIGIDNNPAKEAIARQFGATDFVCPGRVDGETVERIMALTGGGVDYSFECVGHTGLMLQAFQSLSLGTGLCTVIGAAPDGATIDVSQADLAFGRRLAGSMMGGVKPHTDLGKIIDWCMDGKLDVASLITHRMPLDEINEGYDMMRRKEPGAIRTILTLN